MRISEERIRGLVEEILEKIKAEKRFEEGPIFTDINIAIERAEKAQIELQNLGLQKRYEIIKNIRESALKNAEYLAELAHKETGMGRYEHKVQKNMLAALKTPGPEDLQPEAFTGDRGLTLVERAPFGVIAAVTPSTNPTSTIINNAISIISAANSVIFCPHPAAKNCSQETIRIINDAILNAGGPKGLIATIEPITVETTQAVLKHPKVKLNLVTGGPAIVKVAMGLGKKTIAAGPGNPPVVVDETAIFPKCVEDIILGASFDNCILCTAEKEVIITRAVADKFLSYMRKDRRAYELTRQQMDQLAKIVIKDGGKNKEPVLNREYVGKNANVIARAIGLNLSDDVLILWGVVDTEHIFVWTEQLMPVLPVVIVNDIDTAIKFAVEVEGGNHHTFIMHSTNIENLSKMARACEGSIFVKNGPAYMGLGMGEGYATFSIATPTGDGLTRARNFTRPLRCVLVDYFRIA